MKKDEASLDKNIHQEYTEIDTNEGKQMKNQGSPQLWGGRFSSKVHEDMWNYSKSIGVDYVLAKFDVCGSIAHVTMLCECGHLIESEKQKIVEGLRSIYAEISQKDFEWDMNAEDIHSHIEQALYAKIGELAGKMHMGRSRNDQVALDLHMYIRTKTHTLIDALVDFVEVLLKQSELHVDSVIPGYTHMQRAEPIRLAHHLLAYVSMFLRDISRLQDLWKRTNVSPLGAGAFSGSPLPIDNSISAGILGFDAVYENSIDAVSDRDFGVEMLSALSLVQMHVSKMSEELVLWCSKEFGFVELGDDFCTGSSMMPQKKNPDIAELARGKTGAIYGALMALLTMLKGLPLSYNRDMQEDKKVIFDSVETVHSTIVLFAKMLESARFNTAHMEFEAGQDYSNATEVANYLSKKNLPFRQAHEVSGKLVVYGLAQKKLLRELSLAEYKKFSVLFEEDVFDAIGVGAVIEKHTVRGGTAREAVLAQLEAQRRAVGAVLKWLGERVDIADTDCIIESAR